MSRFTCPAALPRETACLGLGSIRGSVCALKKNCKLHFGGKMKDATFNAFDE